MRQPTHIDPALRIGSRRHLGARTEVGERGRVDYRDLDIGCVEITDVPTHIAGCRGRSSSDHIEGVGRNVGDGERTIGGRTRNEVQRDYGAVRQPVRVDRDRDGRSIGLVIGTPTECEA